MIFCTSKRLFCIFIKSEVESSDFVQLISRLYQKGFGMEEIHEDGEDTELHTRAHEPIEVIVLAN